MEVSPASREYDHYSTITDLTQTDVVFAGHGAGRSGSATSTWSSYTYQDLREYFREDGIVANLSPNGLGDHPKYAYKPVDEVMRKLPLDIW